MKLIIEISDKEYEFIKNLQHVILGRGTTKTVQYNVINAIKNGIPCDEVETKRQIMNNEEAIKKLEELCEYKGYNYTVITDKDVEALHNAIEALKNEPFLVDALHKVHAEIKEMNKRIEELKDERQHGMPYKMWVSNGNLMEVEND